MGIIYFIADLLGASGMFFFFFAEVLQLRKILRKHTVRSISYNTYRSKLAALLLTLACFGLSCLWLSFTVLFLELLVVLYIMHLMKKFRGR
jgi:hypothetical protein